MKSVCVHKSVRAEQTKPNGIHETVINADIDLLLTEYIDKYCTMSLQFIEICNLRTNRIKFKNCLHTYLDIMFCYLIRFSHNVLSTDLILGLMCPHKIYLPTFSLKPQSIHFNKIS